MKSDKIRKAIIPVAGLGTRFLPATKAQPKEMLTLVDKPVIQYIVEEAAEAGIEEIIFVTSVGKRAIEDHFDRNFELEYRLEQKKRKKELQELAKISKLAKFAFVRQAKPLGDGHAVLSAYPFIEIHESVAVLFGDDIISSKVPAIGQLIKTYEKYGSPVVAIEEVAREEVVRYGIIGGRRIKDNSWEISKVIEKPAIAKAPSNMAIVGRYILTPEIMKILSGQHPGKGGEIRIADALVSYLKKEKLIYGCQFEGKRYDCGNKLGFLIAQIEFGLKHPELNGAFANYLRSALPGKNKF